MSVTNGNTMPTSMVVNHFNNATFNLTPNNNHEFKNSKITCTNGSIGTITNNVATISNITAETKCSVIVSPMYYCLSGWNNYSGSGSNLTCYK